MGAVIGDNSSIGGESDNELDITPASSGDSDEELKLSKLDLEELS